MKRYLFILTALAALVACVEKGSPEQEGSLGSLRLRAVVEQSTRSSEVNDLILDSAVVNVYKADFSGLVRTYPYRSMTSPFYLAADSYRVDVIAGERVADTPVPASWDRKSYKGSALFEIIPGEDVDVEVMANVSNAVTEITFDQTVAENFNPDYIFSIGLDPQEPQTMLTYDADLSGTEGYFIITGLDEPSFTWTFEGTLTKGGRKFVKTGTIEQLQEGRLYKMNIVYTVRHGDFNFSIYVDPVEEVIDDMIVFEPVSTGLAPSSEYEIWAAHATIHADVDAAESEGATIQFAYRKDGGDWQTVDGVRDSEATWLAELTGLTPSTEYTYRLLIDGEPVGDDLVFTTDDAPRIPNGSFEYVSKVSGNDYYKFYDPNCGVPDGSFMFWGSGNGEGPEGVNGSANMGVVITTIDTGDKVDGKQSVCAQSSQTLGILAAGNLFTGQFAGLVGTEGGKVNFGRPWTSRPSALKLYCKYSTDKMDIISDTPSGVSLSKNDYDRAQIIVALGNWDYKAYGGTKDSPVHVNTTKLSTFRDYFTDGSTIANGELIIHNDGYILNRAAKVASSTSGWKEYVIPLNYRKLDEYPTHIVISCAASQYGDYFTGCSSSKLWIDAVELIYE